MPRRDPFKGCDDFRRARHPFSFTRRQAVLGGLSIYAAGALAPASRLLEAAHAQAAATPGAPVLVSVFLPGGCDLLSPRPRRAQAARPAALRKSRRPAAPSALAGPWSLGLHPSLSEGL